MPQSGLGALRYEDAGDAARLAMDGLAMNPVHGIPSWMLHVMDRDFLETRAGHPPGAFHDKCHKVYLDFQRTVGCGMIDQFIPENPLSMGDQGYDPETPHTGASPKATQTRLTWDSEPTE